MYFMKVKWVRAVNLSNVMKNQVRYKLQVFQNKISFLPLSKKGANLDQNVVPYMQPSYGLLQHLNHKNI